MKKGFITEAERAAGRKTINGERCVKGIMAREAFYANDAQITGWRKEGMPYVMDEDGEIWYPAERCRKWFRGE